MNSRQIWEVTLNRLDADTAYFGRNPAEAQVFIARDDWENAEEPHRLWVTNFRPERCSPEGENLL